MAQSMQISEANGACFPAVQVKHPLLCGMVPGTHVLHDDARMDSVNAPAGHVVQLSVPPTLNLPSSQSPQTWFSWSANWPGPQ